MEAFTTATSEAGGAAVLTGGQLETLGATAETTAGEMEAAGAAGEEAAGAWPGLVRWRLPLAQWRPERFWSTRCGPRRL